MRIDVKLQELRDEYKRTIDPLMRADLVKRANRWKLVQENLEKGTAIYNSKHQSKYNRVLDNSIVDPV